MSGATSPPDAAENIIQQMLQRLQGQQQAPAAPTAPQGDPSFIGLLGSALGGGTSGSVPMSTAEKDEAGRRALLNFGVNMLANSGWSSQPRTFGQIFAHGVQGAQESLGQSEAVTAARGQAQQEYAQKQREDQLARIKEAVPLLKLQQELAMQRKVAGMAPSIGAAGSGGAGEGGVPFAANNPLNIRFAGQPGATNTNGFAAWKTPEEGQAATDALFGRYAEGGINTLSGLISRWAPPSENDTAGYISQVAKATGIDPTAQIDLRDPAVRSKVQAAMAVVEGNKNSRRPTAPGAPAPAASTAAPTAPVQPPARIAPDTASPDVAPTGNQMAGPGAPTGGAVAAPSPGAAGNADAIAAGMVAAGANPATLAPGGAGAPPAPGSIQAQTAGLVVPPGVTPPQGIGAQPAGPPTTPYVPTLPPPGVLVSGNLTPQEQSVVQDARNAYQAAVRVAITPEQRQQAEATLQATLDKELGVRAGRTKEASDALKTWYENDFKAHQEREKLGADAWYKLQQFNREQAAKNTDLQQTLDNNLRLERERGDQARTTAAAASENSYVLDERKNFSKEHDAARAALGDYQALRLFSDAAGTSTPIDNLQLGDKTGRDLLVQWGLGTQAQREKWGAQQAFNAVINKSILAARQGVSMGQLSDRDMNFLQHMTVSQLQDPQTRSDIISFLEQSAYRKKQYMDRVEQLWDGGKGLTWGKARTQAEQEFEKPERDIVPRVPQDWQTLPPQLQQQFLDAKQVKPGSLVRLPNGNLGRYKPPQP